MTQMPKGKTPVGTCLILRTNGKIYLLKRAGSHGAGTWCVPGGWIDQGEDAKDAAARELKEETGIDEAHLRFVGYSNDKHPEGWTGISLWYEVTKRNKEPVIMEPDKATEDGWFPMHDLPEPLFAPMIAALGKVISGDPRKK